MSRHTTFRGAVIDMEAMRRENEKAPAVGNMKVNARGDEIKNGQITRTAEEIARDNHRKVTAVVQTGLKGKMPNEPVKVLEAPKKVEKPKKTKEVELPSGDIIIEDDK